MKYSMLIAINLLGWASAVQLPTEKNDYNYLAEVDDSAGGGNGGDGGDVDDGGKAARAYRKAAEMQKKYKNQYFQLVSVITFFEKEETNLTKLSNKRHIRKSLIQIVEYRFQY